MNLELTILQVNYWMNMLKESLKNKKNILTVPIGSLLLNIENNQYIIQWNKIKPIDHSEILIIQKALNKKWNLRNCLLFITCEPCSMCYNAIGLCKIPKVFFGCYNDKFGYKQNNLYSLEIMGGFMENYWANKLQKYFKNLRNT